MKSHAKIGKVAADNSLHRTMQHANGVIGNMHGAGRAVVAIPAETTRAANMWASAYLPGYHLNELVKGLEAVKRHPDQASRGYSKAKSARTRLEFEINRRKALPAA